MTILLQSVLLLACLVLAVPTLVLTFEILAGALLRSRQQHVPGARPERIAVLVPAHNESSGIAATVRHLKLQLRGADRLLVVADNCTDETASLARQNGADVVERSDPSRRGKGHALAFGMAELRQSAPDVVIIVDADCRTSDGTLAELARLSHGAGRPVQSLDLMRPPAGFEREHAVATFAWIVKNQARPLGLSRLGLPCQLMGTGMAFPWRLIQNFELASSNIVEDLELGLTLAAHGHAPLFSEETLVESFFPSSQDGAVAQRRRWEQGSVQMLLGRGVHNVWCAVRSRNWHHLALALDMCVPPLVLHGAGLALLLAVSAALVPWAGNWPLLIALALCLLFGGALAFAWFNYGREALPPKQLASLFPFLLSKMRVHQGFWRKASRGWTRADRGDRL